MTQPTTTPCGSCPWRRSSRGGPAISRFSIEKARNLVSTVGDGSDAIRPIMACHNSTDVDEYPCIGYVAVVGWTNIAVRLMVIRGDIDLAGIDAECAELDLFASFAEMLEHLEAQEAGA